MATAEELREALNAVEDPELMMGIVDLGLVYDVELDEGKAHIRLTLTSMGCPAGPYIVEQIEQVARGVEGVDEVETEVVWTPPWTPEMMSEDAKFVLGF
jgi:metal-sulfur cluster biosynthetic enzyme